jgi:hypothetical protein
VRLIAHLSRVLPWASPAYVAEYMTIPMLRAYAEQLPEMERHQQMPIAELKWLIAGSSGVKNTKPHDWLTGLARESVRPYDASVAAALRLALSLRLVGPFAMGELDLPRLRASEGGA